MCEHTMKFIIVLRQLGFTLQEIKHLLTLEQKPISTACNEETVQLFSTKIAQIERQLRFYQHALHSLQLTKTLMADGQFEENQEKLPYSLRICIKIYWKVVVKCHYVKSSQSNISLLSSSQLLSMVI